MDKVIILGPKGRFGRAATAAFVAAGWGVTVMGRSLPERGMPGVRQIEGDVLDPAALARACRGQDVIVNALNAPYDQWETLLPRLTHAVVTAARDSGATVLIPGNVYNYGSAAPARLTEQTPWQADTRKGRLRCEMEEAFRSSGVRTIVLRAGDFIEREKSGNWFDAYMAVKSHQGRFMYPGPLDAVHAWAYLPDMARAAVMLAARRDEMAAFEEFGFEGFSLTGAELIGAVEAATGVTQRVSGMPWGLLRIWGLINPLMREVCEMRYLWQVPHRLDESKLRRMVPEFVPTPLEVAMGEILERRDPRTLPLPFSAGPA